MYTTQMYTPYLSHVRRGELTLGLYKNYFTCFCVCKHQSSLLLPPPIFITHTTAILLRDFGAIYDLSPSLPIYGIHHTILVMTISCKG